MNDMSQIFNLQFWKDIIQVNLTPWRMFISVVDISLVTYFIYRIMRYVQGSKVITLVRGVILFVLVRMASGLLGLTTVTWLLNQVVTYGAIAAVVIFQPEIRRALEQLGRTTNILRANKTRPDAGTDHIAAYEKALDYMAKRKIGALIAIEEVQNLNEYVDTGIRLDADISAELLINIFIPNTPLHDGAVIVQQDQISSASSYLPLSENPDISKRYGTRHRAAIGLSEVTDALVLVVSEETGGISITKNGKFIADVNPEELHKILTRELKKDDNLNSKKRWFKRRSGK